MNMKTSRTFIAYIGPGSGAWSLLCRRALAEKSLLCLALIAGVSGCTTVKESSPPRTATEEILLSTASDRGLENTNEFPWLKGKKVFVEDKYFESYDKGQAVGLIRERLSAGGALLVKTDDKADFIVEIRSGVLSMDVEDFLIGIPAMAVPIPLAGTLPTPELALYKSKCYDSLAKFSLFGYERASGQHVESSTQAPGRAYLHFHKVLFVPWRRTDVPELPGHHKKAPSWDGSVPGPSPKAPEGKKEAIEK